MPGDRTGSISVADVVASIVLTVFADVAPADSSSGVHQLEDLVDRHPPRRACNTCKPTSMNLPSGLIGDSIRSTPSALAGEATAPTYEALYSGEWWHPTVATMGENRASARGIGSSCPEARRSSGVRAKAVPVGLRPR